MINIKLAIAIILFFWLSIEASAQSMPPGCYIDPSDVMWCPVTQVFLPVVRVP